MPPSLSHLQQSRDCPITEERRWVSFFGAENAQNVCDNRVAAIDLPFVNAPSATPRSSLGSSASWSITDRQLKLAKKLPYQFSDADPHLTFARNTVPEFPNLIVPDFVAIYSIFVVVPCRLA